jgi:hypothetical protein
VVPRAQGSASIGSGWAEAHRPQAAFGGVIATAATLGLFSYNTVTEPI